VNLRERKEEALRRYDHKIAEWWEDHNALEKLMARFTGTLKVVIDTRDDISDSWDDLIRIQEEFKDE